MVSLLIVAHGNLGDSLIQCAEHVLGRRPPQLESINLAECDDPVRILDLARQQLARLDRGPGVLILTDIYGATPCNTVCGLLQDGQVAAVAGVNLPMLLKVITYRERPLAELLDIALAGGREGVALVPSRLCETAEGGRDGGAHA